MATPQEKLAESLKALIELQSRGTVASRTVDLSRAHRERLLKSGFLQEVMKGWYIAARPDDAAGEGTAWYASFWAFCAAYLRERFGRDRSLQVEPHRQARANLQYAGWAEFRAKEAWPGALHNQLP